MLEFLIGVLVVAIIEYTIFIAASIVSLILNGIATRKINAATSKAEVKKPAILAIISGALFATFGIPAGIIALCMNEKDWEEINAAKVVDVKTTEAKATETEVK